MRLSGGGAQLWTLPSGPPSGVHENGGLPDARRAGSAGA